MPGLQGERPDLKCPLTDTLTSGALPEKFLRRRHRGSSASGLPLTVVGRGVRGDLLRGAKPAHDRTIHVPLPPEGCVFAGEEDAAERARQPRANRRWEFRVKKRVAAARPL